eukprot:510721-Pyramimonas_sp.AAC.1
MSVSISSDRLTRRSFHAQAFWRTSCGAHLVHSVWNQVRRNIHGLVAAPERVYKWCAGAGRDSERTPRARMASRATRLDTDVRRP